MNYLEVQAKITSDWTALKARHAQEIADLREVHKHMWGEYNSGKRTTGLQNVVDHNSAVSAAAAAGKAQREAEKTQGRLEKLLAKIRARHILTGETAEAVIEEIETRIDGQEKHRGNAKVAESIRRMQQSIVELGGVPRPRQGSPVEGSPTLTDEQMDAMLNGESHANDDTDVEA